MPVSVQRAVSPPDLDLRRTFMLQKVGAGDPTAALVGQQFEKVHLGLEGQVVHHQLVILDGQLHHTTTIDHDDAGDHGALRLRLDADVGAGGFSTLADGHEVVRRLHRQHHRLRLLPVPWLFDVAAAVVLQQRVRFVDAARSFSAIARRFGPMTPLGRCFPHPRVIAGLSPDELMPLGVDGQRARALRAIAHEALHSDLLQPLTANEAGVDVDAVRVVRAKRAARLARLPGVGPWTTGMIMGFGFGDPDTLVLGDLHMPHLVTRVLGGDETGSDERMTALLEPFAGQRFRVLRLLMAGGFGKRPIVPGRQATTTGTGTGTGTTTAPPSR